MSATDPKPRIGIDMRPYQDDETNAAWAEVNKARRERDEAIAERDRVTAEALEVYGIVYADLTEGVVDDHDRIMRACNELGEAARRLGGSP